MTVVVPRRDDVIVEKDGTPSLLFASFLESLTSDVGDTDTNEALFLALATISQLRGEIDELKIEQPATIIPVNNNIEKRLDDLQEQLIGFILPKVNKSEITGFLENIVEDITPQLGGNLDTNNFNITMSGTETVDGRDVSVDGAKLDGIETGATADQTAADIRGLGFFDTTNDGSGSGLDADLLDGNDSTAFATAPTRTIFTATLTAGSGTITLNSTSDSLVSDRIGDRVHISGLLLVSSVSSPSGALRLAGLPIAAANLTDNAGSSGFYINVNNLTGSINVMQGRLQELSTTVLLTEFNGTTTVDDVANHIQAGTFLAFDFSYPA